MHAQLGPLRQVVGQLVTLKVNTGHASDQILVQILIGELAAQKLIHVAGVFDLLIVISQLLLGHGKPYIRRGNLLFDHLQLDGGKVRLMIPLVFAAAVFRHPA